MRRWLIGGTIAVLLLVGGATAGYVLYKRDEAKDVRGSSTEEFVTTEAVKPLPPPPTREQVEVVWPLNGYDAARQRVAPFDLSPPFRRVWTFPARYLLEFPPVIAYGRLYFANNSGTMFAVNTKTGKRAWRLSVGRCVAASPAVVDGTVYQSFMNRPPCNSKADPGRLEGEVIAFAAGFGEIRWRTKIGPTESSPLVADGLVYVGDWRGRVYALDATTGRVRWTFQGQGRIKGAVARSGNRLYVGTYDGYLYALQAKTGKLIWRTKSQDRLGGRGQFYSTPAIAYGRVYIGSTDGKVYSFGAASGELRWSHGTGGYVYASPAVWRKTVYVGSYSGSFYALDAATGDVRWRFRADGDISGSAVVLNGVVYFSTFKERTYALNARTGKQLWTYDDGKYAGVVADREQLYLIGHARVYGMVEK
jgi:outer membrane protein assembly factor BamB